MRTWVAMVVVVSVACGASRVYEEFLTGSAEDVRTPTQAGFALEGGGKDQDEVYRWMIRKSGGGDFVVVRASGGDGYNSYLAGLGGLHSVRSLVLKTPEAAQDAEAAATTRRAEALFVAGGDQWNYVRMWRKGTAVGDALQTLIDQGVPFGGTSAGLAVLGQYSFTAEHDSVTSTEALANPYDAKVTIGKDFLRIPLLRRTITDSHFQARSRMGRTLVFLARILKDYHEPYARAIAVDERTALLVEPNGLATVVGEGSVFFIQATGVPARCEPGHALSLEHVDVFRLERGGRFNIGRWAAGSPEPGTRYRLRVREGVVEPGAAE